MKYLLFVLVCSLVRSSYGLTTGMPVIACDDIFPDGHLTEPQDTPAPYEILVDVDGDHYHGRCFIVRLVVVNF